MVSLALSFLFGLAFAIVLFAPETDLGKALRQALVAAPANILNGGLLKALVAVIVMAALIALVVSAPEMVAMFGMADFALYLDFVVLTSILGAVSQVRRAGQRAGQITARLFGKLQFSVRVNGRGSRRVRGPKPRRTPPPSDDPWPAVWAAA